MIFWIVVVLLLLWFFGDWVAAIGAVLLEFTLGLVSFMVGTFFLLGLVFTCYVGYLLLVAGD